MANAYLVWQMLTLIHRHGKKKLAIFCLIWHFSVCHINQQDATMNLKHVNFDQDASVEEMHVTMSNQLVRTAQGLTLPEKRVISLCMTKLDSVKLDNGRYKFKISAQDFGGTFAISDQAAYMQLKDVGKKLMSRVAQHVEEGRRGKVIKRWVWVTNTEYHEGEGYISLTFNHEMTPHLFMLRKEFTSYQLKHAVALRSVYSWRLLELLMQFKSTGLLRIDIDEFCHAMEAPDSARKNFGELRRRIIEPAVKELILKNNLLLEWMPKKAGRKVNGLEFTFKPNPQQSLI
jgi:plasmid replication initiation protein